MFTLFLIVFVDLVGFGLLIPLLPFMVQRLNEGPEVITIVLGLYSLGQVIAAPLWGKLSDSWGRKPVLVITSFGLAASYVVTGYAQTLEVLIFARLFGGVMAGNLGAAQAYMTDITTAETRAKGMGVLGAAFGLGFIFGPAIGGVLGGDDPAAADFVTPSLVAAALTVAATVGAMVFLKESLTPEVRAKLKDRPRASLSEKFSATMQRTALMLLIGAAFVVVTAFAQFETVFALWAYDVLTFGPRQAGLVLMFIGIIGTVVQGGLIGPLTRKFGENKLAQVALVLQAVGYGLLATAITLPMTLLACAALATGSSLFNPSISSLVSKEAGEHERGAVLGMYQSATAMGRIAGPMFSGFLYARLSHVTPFLAAGVLAVGALLLVLALPKKAERA